MSKCLEVIKDEQCTHDAIPGTNYCERHTKDLSLLPEKQQYLIDSVKEQRRLLQLSTSEQIHSLHDEIALMRRLIERRFNMIQDDDEATFLLHSGPVTAMVLAMEKLVKTSFKIETDLQQLMSRERVLQLAQALVMVIIDEIKHLPDYESVADRVTDRALEVVTDPDSIIDAKFEVKEVDNDDC